MYHSQTNNGEIIMQGWNVYLNDKWIDTVYFDAGICREVVKNSLIDHDGYCPAIVILKKH